VLGEAAEDCQGLLFGAWNADGSTEVRHCRPTTSQQSGAFRGAAGGASDVVGFYRMRNAETLQLTVEELATAEAQFSDRRSVVLLVRRDRLDPEAAFFFREDGRYLNVPLLSFPLDPVRLRFTDAPKSEPAAAPADLRPETPARSRGWRNFALVLGVVAISAAGALFLAPVSRWRLAPTPAAPGWDDGSAAPASATALPLSVEQLGQNLKLAWDPACPGIANAISGALDIRDGTATRHILLETAQIRFGSVFYAPVSDEVSVRLTAVQNDGTAEEGSVVVILGTGSPRELPQAGPPVAARRLAQPSRPFLPPPASSEAGSSASSQREDMPAVSVPASPPVILPPAIALPGPRERRIPAVEEPAFVPPVPVFEAGVRTPSALRGIQKRPVTVRVRVLVDEAGRIVSATALRDEQLHVLYAQAAEAAAQRSRFRPARKGSTAVRSEAILNFRFMPEGQ